MSSSSLTAETRTDRGDGVDGDGSNATTTYDDDVGTKRRRDRMRWRIEAMERWGRMYERLAPPTVPDDGDGERTTCVDDVGGIALGVSDVGGAVLANTNMGYWTLHRDNDGITTTMTREG